MTDPKAAHELTEEVSLLRRAVTAFNESLKAILARTEDAEKSISRSKTAIKWTKVVAYFDLFLTVVLLVGGFLFKNAQDEIQETNARLEATNTRLEAAIARLEISVGESCSFYGLIIGSYRPESRPPGQDRATYESNFEIMRRSYRVLNCDPNSIVPPATPR